MTINNFANNLYFGAGKTKILSDFDGTFMPVDFNHDKICNDNPPVDKEAFKEYFDSFEKFFADQNKDGKKTELTISTGRNLHEFNYYMAKIKEKGLRVPNPDKLIITNGGDEFVRQRENYFDSDRKEMFEETDVNLRKRFMLRRFIHSYSPKALRKSIKSFLTKMEGSPVVLEPNTHQGMYGYKDGMTLQEKVQELENPYNYVSLRKDGAYQIRMTTALGSAYTDRLKKIPAFVSEVKGADIVSAVYESDPETCVNCVNDKNRWEMGVSVEIKPRTSGKVNILDKFHHAKIAADKIKAKNSKDLVIVCGDGKNDADMLNLSNYIDSMESVSDFSRAEFKDEVDKLPVIAIYVRNTDSLDDIMFEYERNFNFDGIKRFIIVDKQDPSRPQTLLEAIKLAQIEYSKINKEYKRNVPLCN